MKMKTLKKLGIVKKYISRKKEFKNFNRGTQYD